MYGFKDYGSGRKIDLMDMLIVDSDSDTDYEDDTLRKLTPRQMVLLEDLGQSDEDMQDLHRTLSGLTVSKRFKRALDADKGNNLKRNADFKDENDSLKETENISHFGDVGRNKDNLFSSGDTGKLDRTRQKRLRFADEVEVVYFSDGNNTSMRRCHEPLADEIDQQSRSYRRRLITSSNKDFLLLCQSLASNPFWRGIYNFSPLDKDQELVKLEWDLIRKKRKPISEIFKK